MIGPVSGTGRAMMASLQQAIQKGMPPDQAIQYVKSMATEGVAPLADLYAMMNQFQRLKQQPVQAPQTPPTIRDQLNMAEQQQAMQQMAMQRGLGGLPAPVMEQAQFAGGGIVAFANRGLVEDEAAPEVDPIEDSVLRQYVPNYDTLPLPQQNVIRERLASQVAAAKSETAQSRVPSISVPSKVPTLNEQYRAAFERTQRPVAGYEAEIAARAAAAGEGEAAKLMREKIQQRMQGIDQDDKRARGLALAQIGAQIMQAASQPGATAFGSIGAGLTKGLPMMQELEQRKQDLRDRYDQRMYELQQADELRKAGYYKEATALQTQAQADLRGIERAVAENNMAMDRVMYQEGAATERTRITEAGAAARTRMTETGADARARIRAGAAAEAAAARDRRLNAAIVGKTKQRLSKLGSMDPGAIEYQKAQRDFVRAKSSNDANAIKAAQTRLDEIFAREVEADKLDYQIQSPMISGDPLGLNESDDE